jgi:hypothetical protein
MSVLSALGHMFLRHGPMSDPIRQPRKWFSATFFGLFVGLWWCGLPVTTKGAFQKDSQEPKSEGQRENETRRVIMREEQLFKEMKTSAIELERLSKIFAKRWEAAPVNIKPVFTEDDREQLKQMDKLAKKIRSAQGAYGGDDDSPLPKQFNEQIALLVKLSAEVKEKADKATRQTLSVGILSRATRIQRLVKAIRSASNS